MKYEPLGDSAKEILLVGAGHTHCLVLRKLGMQVPPSARITLVSDSRYAPYSGMLPALIEGRIPFSDAHIDVRHLVSWAGARFVQDAVSRLDPTRKEIELSSGQILRGDILSINTGVGAPLFAHDICSRMFCPVKPVAEFLPWLSSIEERKRDEPFRMGIIGGGVAATELALALCRRFSGRVEMYCLERRDSLLTELPTGARERLLRILKQRGVRLKTHFEVKHIERNSIISTNGEVLTCDYVVSAAGASLPTWLVESGLAVSSRGFLEVDDTFRSISHPDIFALGDVADMRGNLRPKAGVFAVRQAGPFVVNLRRLLAGKSLKRVRQQNRFLKIIGTADGEAMLVRGPFYASGRWCRLLKDIIDGRFMRQFRHLP